MSGQAPVHVAAHWNFVDILSLLIAARSNVNIVDQRGRTPLYWCVSELTHQLYSKDLREQFPCILTLCHAGADMLNLTEWLLHKGPGIADELLVNAPDFQTWYTAQMQRPQSLVNQCRLMIQKRVCSVRWHHEDLVKIASKLPIPHSLQVFVSRKMFFCDTKILRSWTSCIWMDGT